MPANAVSINGAFEYIVGDSKMEELLAWLGANSYEGRREINASENEGTPVLPPSSS